jgi:hypothetical protein
MGRFLSGFRYKPTRLTNAAVGEHQIDELNGFNHRERAAKVLLKLRPHGYSLGTLEMARNAFAEETKLSIEWEPLDETPE